MTGESVRGQDEVGGTGALEGALQVGAVVLTPDLAVLLALVDVCPPEHKINIKKNSIIAIIISSSKSATRKHIIIISSSNSSSRN